MPARTARVDQPETSGESGSVSRIAVAPFRSGTSVAAGTGTSVTAGPGAGVTIGLGTDSRSPTMSGAGRVSPSACPA